MISYMINNTNTKIDLYCRAVKEMLEKRSYDVNLSPNDVVDYHAPLYETAYVPHFQRVSVGGEHCSGVSN